MSWAVVLSPDDYDYYPERVLIFESPMDAEEFITLHQIAKVKQVCDLDDPTICPRHGRGIMLAAMLFDGKDWMHQIIETEKP